MKKEEIEKLLTTEGVEFYHEKTEFAEIIIIVFIPILEIAKFTKLFKSYLNSRICGTILEENYLCIPRFEQILKFYKIPLDSIFSF